MDIQRDERKFPTTSRFRYRTWLGVMGAILIFFPEYLPNTWGNASVYVTSYFYREHGSTSVASTWPHVSFAVGFNVGINLVPFIVSIGRMKLLLASILLFNVAIVAMHVIVRHGFTLMLFAAFGIAGMGGGVLQPLVLKIVSDISDTSKGRYKSVACSGFNFGPVFINYLIGFYMNRENIPPRLIVDNIPIFDNKDLVDRVPSLLILQALSSFACMFVGYCLLLFSLKIQSAAKDDSSFLYESISTDTSASPEINSTPRKNLKINSGTEINLSLTYPSCDQTGNKNSLTESTVKKNGVISQGLQPEDDQGSGQNNYNNNIMTMFEMLKCMSFYVMWFSYGTNTFPKILLNSWYKTFGLMYIKDDRFLVILGSAYSISGGVARLIWGGFLDRFDAKTLLVSVYTFLSFGVILMYFAPALGKNVYFFAVVAVAFGVNLVFPTFLVAFPVYFGDNHFYKVLGMVCTSRVPLSLIASPVYEQLQARVGWFGPFFCAASLVVVSLISIVFILPFPDKSGKIRNKEKRNHNH